VTGDEVRGATFRDKLRGYHPEDVDALLDHVASVLDSGGSAAPLLRTAHFRSKLRGYHPEDVDALLAELRKA
jgi:DivIVA domain-containing protein